MRLELASDPILQQKSAAALVAGASGAGTLLATAKTWALELLGVPLPVVLAAATGAFGARFFLAEGPFWRGLASSAFWTLAGSFGVQLVLWVASQWITAQPPAGVLAGGSLIIAGLGQIAGPQLPELVRAAVENLRRRLEGGHDAR